MKQKILFLLCSVLYASITNACPMYYTFETILDEEYWQDASIGYTWDEPGLRISDYGLGVGSKITYTFLVDYNRSGTITDSSGVETNYTASNLAPNPNATHESIYIELIQGGWAGYDQNDSNFSRNWAEESLHNGIGESDFRLGNQNHSIGDWEREKRFDEMSIGSIAKLTEGIRIEGKEAFLADTYTCTNIVKANPVPEPATMLLFGIGLLGVVRASRREK